MKTENGYAAKQFFTKVVFADHHSVEISEISKISNRKGSREFGVKSLKKTHQDVRFL